MAVVNNSLIKHKLLLGVDDRGKISCHKVNLCFIYFDPSDCIVSISRKLFISNVSIYDHMNINHIPYIANLLITWFHEFPILNSRIFTNLLTNKIVLTHTKKT